MKHVLRAAPALLAVVLSGCQNSTISGGGTDGGAGDAAVGDGRTGEGGSPGCLGCHGSAASLAPPVSVGAKSATTERGVGAHQKHLGGSAWHAQLGCVDCHLVPKAVTDPGHIDTPLPAELTFSPLASSDGAKPSWDGARCSGVYCHGATLSAGSLTAPTWTKVDGTQASCGACHGLPPAAPHTASTDCASCHPAVVDATKKIIAPALHINGKVDVQGGGGHPAGWGSGSVHGPAFFKDPKGCPSCHGATLTGGTAKSCESCHAGWKTKCTFCHGGTDNQTGAPPRAVDGATATSTPGVGRHTSHITAAASHVAIACSGCHKVPADALTPGHLDAAPAEVAFTGLAGASAAYNPSTHQCTNVYCHGNGKAGSGGSALWTGSLSGGCAACHDDETKGSAMQLGGRHKKHILEEGQGCSTCHGCVVNGSKQVTDATRHVNGKVDVCVPSWNAAARTCSPGCHGTETW